MTVDISAYWSFDGYLHIYSNPLDANDFTAGCIEGNDDGDGGSSTSDIDAYTVLGGETLYIVASSWSTEVYGPFIIAVESSP